MLKERFWLFVKPSCCLDRLELGFLVALKDGDADTSGEESSTPELSGDGGNDGRLAGLGDDTEVPSHSSSALLDCFSVYRTPMAVRAWDIPFSRPHLASLVSLQLAEIEARV